MSDPFAIPASERGKLRVFKLDMRPEEARFLRDPAAAAQKLGITDLDANEIEVFPVSDLDELGLIGYLTEGCDIPDDQLDKPLLAALDGWVLVVRSRAFGGGATQLTLDPALSLVGFYSEPGTDWTAAQIETASALPHSAPPLPPRQIRARAQRIGFALVALVMTVFFGGLLWLIL